MSIFGQIKRATLSSVRFMTTTMPTTQNGIRKMRILPKLDFNLTPEQVLEVTRIVLNASTKELDRIGSIAVHNCTFNNVMWPISQLECKVGTELASVNFLQYVSDDENVRKASVEATKLIDVDHINIIILCYRFLGILH